MRTVIVILIGVILSFAFVFGAGHLGRAKITGACLFLPVWLIFSIVDYFNGVKAGYAATDELRIHVLVWIVPAIAAWLFARYL
ncbi:MAG: hypothetical protein ABSE92_08600 [Terriglobales bacterium]|jgi:hypothetical protein